MPKYISISTRRYSTLLKRIFEKYKENVEIYIEGIRYTDEDIPKLQEWWCKNKIIKRTLHFTLKQDGVELFGFHDTPDDFWVAMSERTFVERLAKEKIIRYRRVYPYAYKVFLRGKRKKSKSSFCQSVCRFFRNLLFLPAIVFIYNKIK